MADFCKQCSFDTYGKDTKDLSGLISKEDFERGKGAAVICEGCGPIFVDHEGNCLCDDCLKNHCSKKPIDHYPKNPLTGPYNRDATRFTKENHISPLYLIMSEDATEEYPSGWYYCDEAEQINGPYVTSTEAVEALDKYVKENF